MSFKTLVVDDEPLARDGLRILLSNDPDIAEVEEARDGRQAVIAIRSKRPDLVFLDVQMPEMDGISVVREVGAEHMPAVIFVTAHDEYAIQAFEINAIDYLLKPITGHRFREALRRAKLRLEQQPPGETNREILSLLETIASPRRYITRLAVRSAGKTVFVDVVDIDWMKAAENYVELHSGSKVHLLHVTLNTLEKSLDPDLFLRIHRSLIVNLKRIKELQPAFHGEYVITLQNGTQLQSGRVYHECVKSLGNNPF